MQIAARMMRGFPALSLEQVRSMPAVRLRILFRELPRLEALERIAEVQIAAYPHWSGSKSDKGAGDRARRDFMAKLQSQAFGQSRRYTQKGQRVIDSAEDFRKWFGEWGITV